MNYQFKRFKDSKNRIRIDIFILKKNNCLREDT